MKVGKETRTAERLGAELKAIRDEVRLSQDELSRIAGSRSTIKAIERATHIPKPETLRDLANGLATNGLGARCDVQARRFYNRLMLAAGYISELPAEPTEPGAIDPEATLTDLAQDPEIAALIAEAARKYPAMTDDQRRFFVYALRAL